MTFYLEKRSNFLTKWEKLAKEEKPFKPAEKSLKYYDIKKAEMSHEEIKIELDATNRDLNKL